MEVAPWLAGVLGYQTRDAYDHPTSSIDSIPLLSLHTTSLWSSARLVHEEKGRGSESKTTCNERTYARSFQTCTRGSDSPPSLVRGLAVDAHLFAGKISLEGI